jgi:branched-chain amino acid aminotransferase
MAGSQDFTADPRNAEVLVYVNGALVPRAKAMVSIFDAGFSMGDGVWEGLRLHKGRMLFLEAHMGRLMAGAGAIGLKGVDRAALERALDETIAANGMSDGVHLRLMVTRGEKATVNQDPRNALGPPTVVVTAEYKLSAPGRALRLATSAIRCSGADTFNMRLNSHSRLNLITALLEAIEAGADEALMLDPRGFVSSCNATNLFFVKNGGVFTSTGEFCFNGITRANIIALCRAEGLAISLRDYGLDEAREADEAFVTGTLGGVTPVGAIDGHEIAAPGPITLRLALAYEAMKDREAGA